MNQDEWDRLTLRIPLNLNLELKKRARATGRSLNAEVIKRLSDSIEVTTGSQIDAAESVKDTAEKISSLAKKIALLSEKTSPLKEEFLSEKEQSLLAWFNDSTKKEQEQLLDSLPEIMSLVKKMR